MKNLLRNMRGSLFWKHTLAVVMAGVVLITLLPMSVNVAKADEEILGSDDLSFIQMTALRFTAQSEEDGVAVSKDVLSQPEEEPLYLPQNGMITASVSLQITEPTEEITAKNYIYSLPNGLTATGVSTNSIQDADGNEIVTLGIVDKSVMIRFDKAVLENVNTTISFDVYTTVSDAAYEGGTTCSIFFPAMAGNIAKTVTFSKVPLDVLAEQAATEEMTEDGSNTAEDSTDADSVSTIAGATDKAIALLDAGDAPMAIAAGDLLNDSSADLVNVIFQATYVDEFGGKHTVVMENGKSYDLPYNATISARLEFVLGDGNDVEVDTPYVYQLPDSIRVDVDVTHELKDKNGDSIGTVHISPDGTLTFVFNDRVRNNTDIPFYVEFEGGFSDELKEEGAEADVKFPTESGGFEYHVDMEESTGKDLQPEISKSGVVITGSDGKKYIEWTIELNPNGQSSLSGTIEDTLPNGLKYETRDGYPRLIDTAGHGSITDVNVNGQTVKITVKDVDTYYRAKVQFLTSYDETIFEGTITENTRITKLNEATFVTDTTDATAQGSVDITPDLVQKSATNIGGRYVDEDGKIRWTVTLNREHFNIAGATYTDTVGEGHKISGNVTVQPGNYSAEVNPDGTGFTITFPEGAPITDEITITYETEITDFSQNEYKNSANLTKDDTFDVDKDASVPWGGQAFVNKSFISYDPVTQILTWQIQVNPGGFHLTDVTVSDVFAVPDAWHGKMKFFDTDGPITGDCDKVNGPLKFHYDELTGPATITVRFVIDPDFMEENAGKSFGFKNHVDLDAKLNDTEIEADDDAETWLEIKPADLINKAGELERDNYYKKTGMVRWYVDVINLSENAQAKTITFTDVIPEGMEYVEGSFELRINRWTTGGAVKPASVSYNPSTRELSCTFSAQDPGMDWFFKNAFCITYQTKVPKLSDAAVEKSYVNNAHIEVSYDGFDLEDSARATVTDTISDVLEKDHIALEGKVVTWRVTINPNRYDMSDYHNATISDQLADYFDYVPGSGTLYLVSESGSRTEVAKTDYKVVCVNQQLMVVLPENLGSNRYEFEFKTEFNVLNSDSLAGENVVNRVTFEGNADKFEQKSADWRDASFSSSSAGSSLGNNTLRIRKVDAGNKSTGLAGARFELYVIIDEATGTKQLIGEAVSDEDGYAVFEGLNPDDGYTYEIIEVQPPAGYFGEADRTFKLEELETEVVGGVTYYNILLENTRLESSTTVGIVKTDAQGKVLAGAEFGLYKEGVANPLQRGLSGTDGKISFTVSDPGTYYIREIQSPAGYKKTSTEIKVVVTKSDAGVYTVTYDNNGTTPPSVANTKALGTLVITKLDETGDLLDGAWFELYSDANASNRVGTRQQTKNGKVTFTGLELGKTYWYREVEAPYGYVLDNTLHSITVGTTGAREDASREVTVYNELATGSIRVRKVDDSVPAKPLQGVVFGLYYKNGNPYYLNGNDENKVHYTVTTDANGSATFTNIPFGEYIVKEMSSLPGYSFEAEGIDVVVDSTGTIEVGPVVNKLIRFNIRITKKDSASGALLDNAEFGLYTSGGVLVQSGFTRNGELTFNNIPYGDYYIEEINPPAGYLPLADKGRKTITADMLTQQGRTFLYEFRNIKQSGSIVLTKYGVDSYDDKTILPGAEFTLYDSTGAPIKTAVSGVDGKITFTDLTYGTYYLEETLAPDGYIRDMNRYEIEVDSETPVSVDVKGLIKEGAIDNAEIPKDPPFISFKVRKTDTSTPGKPLAGAVFQLFVDGEETDYTAVTGEDGYAYFRRISLKEFDLPDKPWGQRTYTVVEIESPYGYKLNSDPITLNGADFSVDEDPDKDDVSTNNGRIKSAGTVIDEQILGSITIIKQGALSSSRLNGAEFTLYTDAACKNPVADTITKNPVVTAGDGTATFSNLPSGTYYVKETKAPAGYTINSTVYHAVISGEESGVITPSVTVTDERIQVQISKRVLGGATEVPGAKLQVVDADGTVVDSWTSDGSVHKIDSDKLEVGKTYTLEEVEAPKGYGYAASIQFTILNDGSIRTSGELAPDGTTIIMRDRKITVSVSKIGLNADGVAVEDEALENAILAIYQGNTEICRWTTGSQRHPIPDGILVAPKVGFTVYTIREISAPTGYMEALSLSFAVNYDGTVHYLDENGGLGDLIPNSGQMTLEDIAKKVGSIYIRKVDNLGTMLPNATFSIINKNSGQTVLTWNSTEVSKEITNDYVKPGITYILRETPPAGYVGIKDIEFEVQEELDGSYTIVILSGTGVTSAGDTLEVMNTSISLRIRKQDENGMPLAEAQLELWEYSRVTQSKIGTSPVASFTSSAQLETIDFTQLKCGHSYVLHEAVQPLGYKLADDIIFTIDENGKVIRDDGVTVTNNVVVMKDEEADLSIIKVSENGEPLPGVTLRLTSAGDNPKPIDITWTTGKGAATFEAAVVLPGWTYILTEIKAPEGYAYSDPIEFTIGNDKQVYIDGVLQPDRTIVMTDNMLKLTVSKQDTYSKEEVPNAELGIYAAGDSSKPIVSWWTGKAPKEVDTSKLVAGKLVDGEEVYAEYILREITVPTGYNKAPAIYFAIDHLGNIYLGEYDPATDITTYDELVEDNFLTMYEEPRFSISKQDFAGDEVEGATLTVKPKNTDDDPDFGGESGSYTWESGKEPTYFDRDFFKPGVTYVLEETNAPDGYAYAESIEFMIDEDGTVYVNGKKASAYQVVMVDDAIEVFISKQDITNGKELPGARLVIKDEDGKVIYEFDSKNQPTLMPGNIFTLPKEAGEYAYYSLTEITAPDGYEIAETIYFALDRAGNVYIKDENGKYVLREDHMIIMKDQPSITSGSTTSSESSVPGVPKTGDSTPLAVMILLGMVSLFGFLLMLYFMLYGKRGIWNAK